MLHITPYLPALTMRGTSLLDDPSVLAGEARKLSHVLKDVAAHKSFGRMTAHGVALDFECTGFKK